MTLEFDYFVHWLERGGLASLIEYHIVPVHRGAQRSEFLGRQGVGQCLEGQGCGFVFGAECYVRITGESDNNVWPGHLELHIPIMRYGLKAREFISPQQGVIPTIERGHLERYLFGPIVLRRAEYHVKCDFARASSLPTGNDSSEGRAALLDAAPVYFHFVECIFIDEV